MFKKLKIKRTRKLKGMCFDMTKEYGNLIAMMLIFALHLLYSAGLSKTLPVHLQRSRCTGHCLRRDVLKAINDHTPMSADTSLA